MQLLFAPWLYSVSSSTSSEDKKQTVGEECLEGMTGEIRGGGVSHA